MEGFLANLGYARVSTNGQDLAIQLEALKRAECRRIFKEKVSGAKAENRPELGRLIRAIEPDDVVIVTRLDRLARSTRDFLNIMHDIAEAGGQFRSLAEPWADTTNDLGQFLLTILAGLAEFERKLIRARTEAGITRARDKGVQFGRKPALNAKQKRMIADRHADGVSMPALADQFDVGVATIWRAIHGRRGKA
jgi:DNA invertase Pin-like site-specific DNA recombinase